MKTRPAVKWNPYQLVDDFIGYFIEKDLQEHMSTLNSIRKQKKKCGIEVHVWENLKS